MSKNKYPVKCMFQENSLNDQQILVLEEMIRRVYREFFGSDIATNIIWLRFPHGQAYLAGRVSTASSISVTVDDGFDRETRQRFMRTLVDEWRKIVDCPINDVIVTAMDLSYSEGFMGQLQARYPSGLRGFPRLARMMVNILLNKIQKKYLTLDINFSR